MHQDPHNEKSSGFTVFSHLMRQLQNPANVYKVSRDSLELHFSRRIDSERQLYIATSLGGVFLDDDAGIGIYIKIVEENHGLCRLCVFQSASDTTAFRRSPMFLVLWHKGVLMARLRDKETHVKVSGQKQKP